MSHSNIPILDPKHTYNALIQQYPELAQGIELERTGLGGVLPGLALAQQRRAAAGLSDRRQREIDELSR